LQRVHLSGPDSPKSITGMGSSNFVSSANGWHTTTIGTLAVFAPDGYAGTWFKLHRMNSHELEPLSTIVHTTFGDGGTWYLLVS